MFTGIIEATGVIEALTRVGSSARLTIASTLGHGELLSIGASIAVDGVCLTVTSVSSTTFSADLSPETMRVTTLGQRRSGEPVNLERAMRLSDRLEGHFLAGHIDGVGVITRSLQEGDARILTLRIPSEGTDYCIRKGSIAIDGISLTINDMVGREISLTVIPHTSVVTTIGRKTVGDRVNIEFDVIGKYVKQLLGR